MVLDHMAYVTVDELRDVLRDQLTAYESEYERAILAGSRQIDQYCGRRFYVDDVATSRLFRAQEPDLLWTGDISTTDDLVVEIDDADDGSFGSTWTLDADFQMEPGQRPLGEPYDRIAAVGGRYFPTTPKSTPGRVNSRRYRVRVTAKWGWPSIPDPVKQATIIQAIDHFKAKDLTHIAATYGNSIRVARAYTPGAFGRKIKFNLSLAPALNPEAESLVSSLRWTVLS